ncbi:MAG: HsmA family protein [Anaerolineales bacterium]
MTTQALIAVILITLALVFYSIGVWSERFAGKLKGWHLAFFWAGLAFDTIGTTIMMEMADEITSGIHGLTGGIAILLMIIHALWATVVLVRKDKQAITNFHKFSVAVWVFWLIPYFTGFAVSMRR